MSRAPWPARWGVFSRPTVERKVVSFLTGSTGLQTLDSMTSVPSSLGMAGALDAYLTGFTLAAETIITKLDLFLVEGAAPMDGDVYAYIYTNTGTATSPDIGTLVATSTTIVDASTVSVGGDWTPFTFNVRLDAGEYVWVVERVNETTGNVSLGATTVFSATESGYRARTSGTWGGVVGFHLGFRLYGFLSNVPVSGALLRVEDSGEVYDVRGETDPTNLYGIAAEGYGGSMESGYLMVYRLKAGEWFGMMGDRDPITGDVDTEYGIVLDANGNWIVDTSDTTATRVTVEDVDLRQKYYFVSVISSHIQS